MIVEKHGYKLKIDAEGLDEADIKILLTPDGKGLKEKTEALNRILAESGFTPSAVKFG